MQTFGKSGGKENAEVEKLRRTEELFLKALQNAGVSYAVDELKRTAAENAQESAENADESVIENGETVIGTAESVSRDGETVREKEKSPAKGEVRYSLDEDSGKDNYSYSALNAKEDIRIVTLSSDMPRKKDGKIDRGAVIDAARKNARAQNNPNNNEKETYVYVPDLGLDVRVSRGGIEHGLKRNPEDTAIATMNNW